jgi:tryptophan 7-halogenase
MQTFKKINHNFKFCIVGGGTAGWLTALFLNRYYPNSSVTVIESSDIGILGAGEGTTTHFVNFLKELNIDLNYIFKNASATLKNGIKFTNYNGDGKSYFHGFKDNDNLDYSYFSTINNCNSPLLALEKISSNQSIDGVDFSSIISDANLSKFDNNFNKKGEFALHFNANYLAKALKEIGLTRGINLVDDIVNQIKTNEDGYINELVMNNQSLECDFVFDCTGFKRLIIGDFYKSEWKSYKDNLPVNRAIPFFIPINEDEEIPPYTEAIAMKYGWMWKIPTQERYGCGYVFDKNMVSDEEAKKEVDEYLGYEVQSPRQFNFSAGTYKDIWIKNCIAVGLSSGFIEPKEATSIWVSIQQLHNFLQHTNGVTNKNQKSIDEYNKRNMQKTDEILEFIYLHYITKRADTDFWKNFTSNNHMPEKIKEYLNECKTNIPNFFYHNKEKLFTLKSYYAICAGLKLFDKNIAIQTFQSLTQGITYDAYINKRKEYFKELYEVMPNLKTHNEYIKEMKV